MYVLQTFSKKYEKERNAFPGSFRNAIPTFNTCSTLTGESTYHKARCLSMRMIQNQGYYWIRGLSLLGRANFWLKIFMSPIKCMREPFRFPTESRGIQ